MSENGKKNDNGRDWRDLLKNSKRKVDDRGRNPRSKFRFSLWHLVLAVALLFAFNMFTFRNRNQGIPYSEFKALITNGSIREVYYSGTSLVGYPDVKEEIRGDVQSVFQGFISDESGAPQSWKSERIAGDATLISLMDENGVVYRAIPEANNYFINSLRFFIPAALILLLFWRFVARRMRGIGGSNVMGFGQNHAKIVAENDLTTRFKDVAGCDEAKDELVEIVDFLKSPTKYTNIGGKIPKGALLVGAPGTGKTLLARAVAGEAGVTFFRMSGADFVEMFVGVGAARVRDLFKQAREKAPCIIFIDELDAIGKNRAGSIATNDEREQTLNQLLVEMDGFDSTIGVIILAATNRPEVLDPALLRPGRFDRQVAVDKPDQIGREAILRIHSVGVKLEKDVDLSDVAKATAGLAGADLANIVNEAALLAVRFGREKVSRDDFLEAIEKAAIGLQKKNKILNPHEREVIAYHETGHALVNVFTPNQHLVKKITIVPRGYGVMGYMLPVPEEERSFHTREELIGNINVTLGGRAAEKIIYNTISTGAGNDIVQATDIARSMITRFGMSEKFTNVSLDKRPALYLGPDSYSQGREHSEETQRYIDEEINQIIGDAYKRVIALLTRHRKLLNEITVRLLDKETIERDELMELIRSDRLGNQDFETRKEADLKPSEKARSSGDARNAAIKERMAEKRNAEEEAARKAAEEGNQGDMEPETTNSAEQQ